MDKELYNWTTGMLDTMQSALERLSKNTLSEKDRNSVGVMLVQLAQAIRSDPEYTVNNTMHDIEDKLFESFSALMNSDSAALEASSDAIRQLSLFNSIMITEADREKFKPREDGRTYIDLPQMPREQFMKYVEHLKSIGAKFDGDKKQWYVDEAWQMPDINQKNKEKKTMSDINLTEIAENIKEQLEGIDSIMGKTQAFLEFAERDRDLFSNDERNVIINYAYKTNDFNKTIELMNGLVNAELQSVRIETRIAAEKEIDTINGSNFVSIFSIRMYDEEIFYENTSGLDVDALCKAYGECESPFVDMKQYGRQIDMADYAVMQQKEELLKFSIEFDVDNDVITIFDGEKFEERGLKETVFSEKKEINNNFLLTAIYYDENNKKQVVSLEATDDDLSTSDPIQRIIKLVKEQKPEWKENERCYIQEHNNDTGKTSQAGIFLVKSGRDVTPVEINIPPVSNFKEVTTFLKEKGAKFDGDIKIWYMERGKYAKEAVGIQQYLDSKSKKPSVITKLQQNQDAVKEKSNSESEQQRIQHKDSQERV